ncbi:MAG: HD-GYP domain-containing protein, partial [Vulcanimicrobiota bacterium]
MITKKSKYNFLLLFALAVLIISMVLGFYVSFYLNNFSRFFLIMSAGALGTLFVVFIIYFSSLVLKKYTQPDHSMLTYLVIFPLASLISGILVEISVFRLGGIHYLWIIGTTITISIIGVGIFIHQRIRELILDSLDSLEKVYGKIIFSLNQALEAIEPYNTGHCERVAWYSVHTARKMGMSDEQCLNVLRAGLLHDLGKIG